MDKCWIDLLDKLSFRYVQGIDDFIRYTYQLTAQQSINYPCKNCINQYHFTQDVVRDYLLRHRFIKAYKNWTKYGEAYFSCRRVKERVDLHDDMVPGDQLLEKVQDIMAEMSHRKPSTAADRAGLSYLRSSANEDALKFFRILDDTNIELYPGCHNYSQLSFIIELLHLEVLNQWTNSSFDVLLELLRKVLSGGSMVCESYYQACKLTKDLGFTYKT